jgi:hypothetical protein
MIGKHGRMRGPGSLTEECEAFLAGGFGELVERAGMRPPPWAWLNAIAHAELEDLTRMAHHEFDRARGQDLSDGWAQATSFLATELLHAGGDNRDAVRRMQVDVLVPIELAWCSDTPMARSPSDLVREVRAALKRRARRQPGLRHGWSEVEA